MNWLDHNPIADMYGPTFLFFYAVLALVTLAFCRWRVQSSDQSGLERPMLVPANPDPGEIAYLRGGANEVLRLMIFDLTERGYLEIGESGKWITKGGKHVPVIPIIQSATESDLSGLTELEQEIVRWFQLPRMPNEVFQSEIARRIQEHYRPYEEQLSCERLLVPDDTRKRMRAVTIRCNLFLIGTGLYKVLSALSHDHENVGFLICLIIAAGILLPAMSKSPRLTKRGRDYINRLQSAFGGVNRVRSTVPDSAGGGPTSLLLGIGVFGLASLADTPYSHYRTIFVRGANGAGYSGGSCSSPGCGSSCSSASSISSSGDSGGGGGGDGGGGGGGCGGCSSSS